MSEVRLNIFDHEGSINGAVQGAAADAVIAALSAEPQTIAECWQRAKDGGIASEAKEAARLNELKTKWLEEPQPGFD